MAPLPLAPVAPFAMTPTSSGASGPPPPSLQKPSTASHQEASVLTLNGLSMITGSIPDNTDRNMRACRAPSCRADAVMQCDRRYCKACCTAVPLRKGERCRLHKGTSPPKVSNSTKKPKTPRRQAGVDEEDTFDNDDDDNPLDINITHSRNIQREWQEQWVATDMQALADVNYRSTGRRLVLAENHYMAVFIWHKV